MISFYPGPSRVYSDVPKYMKDAYNEGIMSINHRSDEFMAIARDTISLLREKLNIPDDYMIFFPSSATECWEIIAQSLNDDTSYHFFNGAFGEKWFDYTRKLKPYAIGYRYNIEAELKIKEMDLSMEEGLICLTQNETSNGTQVSNKRIAKIRKEYPAHLIAVDATSSMGGINLNFENADVWYASVQKCFGLPAGMAVMICSPAAIAKAEAIGERSHYNSLLHMVDKMKLAQTTHTPNVLNIYLLMRVLEAAKPIQKIDDKLKRRFKDYKKYFSAFQKVKILVDNPKVRSHTVLPISTDKKLIDSLKLQARKANLLLGNGYGEFKENTFRIANFPAIKNSEIKTLKKFLDQHLS